MRNDDVRDLISQLNQLQLQQTELFARLERAVNSEAELPEETEQEPDRTGSFAFPHPESEADRTGIFAFREAESEPESESQKPIAFAVYEPVSQEPRPFAIGDYVTVKNPNLFQANKGTITKIGNKRITVTSLSGQKIQRAPKNLSFLPL